MPPENWQKENITKIWLLFSHIIPQCSDNAIHICFSVGKSYYFHVPVQNPNFSLCHLTWEIWLVEIKVSVLIIIYSVSNMLQTICCVENIHYSIPCSFRLGESCSMYFRLVLRRFFQQFWIANFICKAEATQCLQLWPATLFSPSLIHNLYPSYKSRIYSI